MAQADTLVETLYGELRFLARQRLAREPAGTLQPTALVHEAWLRLAGEGRKEWPNRALFFSAAAEAMRRILIERARRRRAVRHGGGLQRTLAAPDEVLALPTEERLLAVDEALQALAAADPAKAELVKLRYFAGLSTDEAAAVLGIGSATAKRWWAYSRAWLLQRLEDDG